MSVIYRLIQEKRQTSSKRGEWYARVKTVGECTLADVAEVVQRNCSVKRSDCKAVLTEFTEVLRDMLQAGQRVKIDGLGAFRIAIMTKPAKTPDEFSVDKNIVGVRLLFQPETKKDSATKKRRKPLLEGCKFVNSATLANKDAMETPSTDSTSSGN